MEWLFWVKWFLVICAAELFIQVVKDALNFIRRNVGKKILTRTTMRAKGEDLLKQVRYPANEIRPIVNHQTGNNGGDKAGKETFYKSASFCYFFSMFCGGLIGSLLGTVLVKILTQLL